MKTILSILCLMAMGVSAWAASVTFTWQAMPNSAGYAIYYTAGIVYSNRVHVGLVTQATVTNLSAGTNYRFFAVSYGSDGKESAPSDFVTHTPGDAPLPPGVPSPVITLTWPPPPLTEGFEFQITDAEPGFHYTVQHKGHSVTGQYETNFSIGTNTVWEVWLTNCVMGSNVFQVMRLKTNGTVISISALSTNLHVIERVTTPSTIVRPILNKTSKLTSGVWHKVRDLEPLELPRLQGQAGGEFYSVTASIELSERHGLRLK
jgi:hypothetical protein